MTCLKSSADNLDMFNDVEVSQGVPIPSKCTAVLASVGTMDLRCCRAFRCPKKEGETRPIAREKNGGPIPIVGERRTRRRWVHQLSKEPPCSTCRARWRQRRERWQCYHRKLCSTLGFKQPSPSRDASILGSDTKSDEQIPNMQNEIQSILKERDQNT